MVRPMTLMSTSLLQRFICLTVVISLSFVESAPPDGPAAIEPEAPAEAAEEPAPAAAAAPEADTAPKAAAPAPAPVPAPDPAAKAAADPPQAAAASPGPPPVTGTGAGAAAPRAAPGETVEGRGYSSATSGSQTQWTGPETRDMLCKEKNKTAEHERKYGDPRGDKKARRK